MRVIIQLSDIHSDIILQRLSLVFDLPIAIHNGLGFLVVHKDVGQVSYHQTTHQKTSVDLKGNSCSVILMHMTKWLVSYQ